VVASAEQLAEHAAAWEDLARNAVEPNVFYEPWMLIPAATLLSSERQLSFVFIYGSDTGRPNESPLMCGMFPLERTRSYRGLPVSAFKFWKHEYCFLCTPLVRSSVARECLETFLSWLSESSTHLMEFNFVGGDGPASRLLIDLFSENGTLTFTSESLTRAVLHPAHDGNTYVRESLAGRRIKDLRRCERQLAAAGSIEYDALDCEGDFRQWIDEFLQLEASGWKGRAGTAIVQRPADLEFFRRAAAGAFERGRLMMLALRVAGKPVAMKCNFLAGGGSFAFKIAFDESFARFSPGVLLELENIHRVHSDQRIEWMDSCAAAEHPMINRLWRERRVIQTTLIGRSSLGSFVVSVIPLLRWANRAVKQRHVKHNQEVNR
ncbi:MAG TPA: GNAT family N-acetyltransferase, partial [Blastocatellia bacterium]|nr:GNAT family N-acetyltransferase [Blastocatellia bacterium]